MLESLLGKYKRIQGTHSKGGMTGALGVLGPTRLPYPRATSMVRYMGSLLGELVSLYYS